MGHLALNIFAMFRVFLAFASRVYDFFFLEFEDYPTNIIGIEAIDVIINTLLSVIARIAPGMTLFGLMFDAGVMFLIFWTLFNWAQRGLVTT